MPHPDPPTETTAERRRTNRRLAKRHTNRRRAVPKVTGATVDQRAQERIDSERSIASRLAAQWFASGDADNPTPPPLIVFHYAYWQLLAIDVDVLDPYFHRDRAGKPVEGAELSAAWVWWTRELRWNTRKKLAPPVTVWHVRPSPAGLARYGHGDGPRRRAPVKAKPAAGPICKTATAESGRRPAATAANGAGRTGAILGGDGGGDGPEVVRGRERAPASEPGPAAGDGGESGAGLPAERVAV